jgi:plasmid stability protein
VEARLPDLARAARRRAVQLRAAAHGATTTAEREALEAVYAYERVLSQNRGKKTRASDLPPENCTKWSESSSRQSGREGALG